MTMANEQRDCEAALHRLQRALAGEPKRDTVVEDLMRQFGMAENKEVRDERV